MKRIMKLIIGSTLCLANIGYCANAATDSSSETYKNQRGSTMTLAWHANSRNTGTLTGTFTTAVGNCPQDVGIPMPLAGFFNGNAVAITVNFPHCKQVVAMVGNLTDNKNSLHTIWLDANQAEDPRGKNWNSNIVGSDTYQKMG
ncbi:MAG: avidin/streptavidin family protein [Gammaproteobacteria bacterium]